MSSSAVQENDRLYLVHPLVDFFFMGGISILVYFFTVTAGSSIPYTYYYFAAVGLLQFLFNWPHFAATSYRLYSRKATADSYPVTAYLAPLLLILATVACFYDTEVWAVLWVRLMMFWSPYHYTGQAIGITRLYSKRAGWTLNSLESWSLTLYMFTAFLAPLLAYEYQAMPPHYALTLPPLGVPRWIPQVMYFICTIAGLIWIGCWLGRRMTSKQSAPLICLVPSVALFFWFVMAPSNRAYNVLVPLFHSLQYMLIAWVMELNEKMVFERPRFADISRRLSAFWVSSKWYVINVLLGIVLFYFLPRFGAAVSGHSLIFAEGVIIATIQIQHFLADGVIWRLREPRVASPLMLRWRDLFSKPLAATAAVLLTLGLATSTATASPATPFAVVRTMAGDVLIRLADTEEARMFETWVSRDAYRLSMITYVVPGERITFGGYGTRKNQFTESDKGSFPNFTKPVEYHSVMRGQVFARAEYGDGSFEIALNKVPVAAAGFLIGEVENGWAAIDELSRMKRSDIGVPLVRVEIGQIELRSNAVFRMGDFVALQKLPRDWKESFDWSLFVESEVVRAGLVVIALFSILIAFYVGRMGVRTVMTLGVIQGVIAVLLLAGSMVPALGAGFWQGVALLLCFLVVIQLVKKLDSLRV